jgi:hypothetical protein
MEKIQTSEFSKRILLIVCNVLQLQLRKQQIIFKFKTLNLIELNAVTAAVIAPISVQMETRASRCMHHFLVKIIF